jgi:cytochrome c biogenesis protein
LLISGIFAMLYVRERRLWIWLSPKPVDGGAAQRTDASMAFSVNRKTLDSDREFEHLKYKLLGFAKQNPNSPGSPGNAGIQDKAP